jgi:hypothetical protein
MNESLQLQNEEPLRNLRTHRVGSCDSEVAACA